MHMADALLSPPVAASFWAGTLGTIGYASRKLASRIEDRKIPLMGVLGAFLFAAQMINFTIPGTGSSGHLGGGLLLAILLGPEAAFLVMASVLTVQALFFADGGLLALGCNIWNLGIYPCFVAYPLVYRPLAGPGATPRRIAAASMAAAVAGLQMGAFSVVLETLLSGKSALPFGTFLLLMQPIHLAIGLVEGLVTAGVINYVRAVRPEMLDPGRAEPRAAGRASLRGVILSFALLAVVTGGAFSWFASTHPDGLEWSIARVTGKGRLPAAGEGVEAQAGKLQERTSILPGYRFREGERRPPPAGTAGARPATRSERSVSGLVGAALVLAAVFAIGWAVRAIRGKRFHGTP